MTKSDEGKVDHSERGTRERARRKQAKTNEALKKQARENRGRDFQELKLVNPTAFNARAEEAFIELVRGLIESNGGKPYPIWEVYREASFELKISTETVKRYLFKHSARRAEFRVFDKKVMLNPNYVSPEDPLDDADEEIEEQQ